jgi:hypothetical protein
MNRYRYGRVNRGKGEYVRAIHHLNSRVGFWARLKLSIRGTHILVSKRHLSKSVAEFPFRDNIRRRPGRRQFAMPSCAAVRER